MGADAGAIREAERLRAVARRSRERREQETKMQWQPITNASTQRLTKERVPTPMQKPITFTYTNHQNETRERIVRPISLEWLRDPGRGHSPGWFLRAFDLEKREQRSFALTRIHTPGTPPLSSFTLLFFEDTI